VDPRLLAAGVAGLVAGLYLLVRGFGAYRMAARIGDTAASRIASAAVGELLVTGTVEPAELTLVSPLQSEPCVFYRARIDDSDGDTSTTAFRDERAVGFRVRDATGELRVFPRGARFDVPSRFDERTGSIGEEPVGLRLRSGGAFAPGPLDREAQIAALLTVQPAGRSVGQTLGGDAGGIGWSALPRLASPTFGTSSRTRHYTEARLEPGDVVTILGRALPFDQLDDPEWADRVDGGDVLAGDPEIAADLAAARAAGTLESDPAEAWGNAAIPGFGIGRPVRPPELDADANVPALAPPADAARFARTFEIAPNALVLASSPDIPLVISQGAPAAAAGRHEREFLIGLLGAVLAIVSAVGLAILAGGLGR
jgi:hypothetical protein